MSIILMIYIVAAVLLLLWIVKTPHTPTSLDPEKASVWDFPGWYMLIMMLCVIGVLIKILTDK